MEYCSRALEEIRDNGFAQLNSAQGSGIVEAVRTTLNAYKKLVASFFTDKADEIHFIYTSIKNNAFPYNKVETTDCNTARHNYNEYLEGFQTYIDRLMDLETSDEVDHNRLNQSLKDVADRDANFILKLMNSETNPKEPTDINGAMKNVEVLIDLYHQMDNLCNMLAKYSIRLSSVDPGYRNEMVSGLVLMAKSIIHFHHVIIFEILDCYDAIHNSIQKRTPVNGEKKVEEYQIF